MRQQSSVVFALALLVAAGTLAFTGPASADEKETNGKAEMAAAAKVTIEQAIKTVSDKVAGKVVEAELEKIEKKHNKLVWKVEVITAENKTMEVHIDADTGAVIRVEEQNFKPAAKVTIEQAIKTVSDKVAGKVVEAELEKKHNKLVWEVEVITAENKTMEVHIDADTGAVIHVEEQNFKPANF